ncbi:MAG: hypothetical protein Q8O46_04170 [bacterium]|nr:hypothetical protein [bacterium]
MPDKLPKMALIFSVIFLIFSVFIFIFLYKITDKKDKEFRQFQLEWQAELKTFEKMKRLDRSMKDIEEERNLLGTHFAKSSDVVPFLDTIEEEALSVRAKAEISSVDAGKNNSSLTIVVKASGSFESLYKFLTLLENSPYELEFISMNMQKLGGQDLSLKGELSQWDATFKVKLLSFLP